VRVPGTRARVPSGRVRTACRACESARQRACAGAATLMFAIISWKVLWWQPLRRPVTPVTLCCAIVSSGGRREGGRIGRNPPPFGRTIAYPPACPPPHRREIGWNGRATPQTLIPSIATRGPSTAAWPSPNYPPLPIPLLQSIPLGRTRGSASPLNSIPFPHFT